MFCWDAKLLRALMRDRSVAAGADKIERDANKMLN